jgi:hypothetical protein
MIGLLSALLGGLLIGYVGATVTSVSRERRARAVSRTRLDKAERLHREAMRLCGRAEQLLATVRTHPDVARGASTRGPYDRCRSSS